MPTEYQKFMSTEMKKIKASQPNMNAKSVMREGAARWRCKRDGNCDEKKTII